MSNLSNNQEERKEGRKEEEEWRGNKQKGKEEAKKLRKEGSSDSNIRESYTYSTYSILQHGIHKLNRIKSEEEASGGHHTHTQHSINE